MLRNEYIGKNDLYNKYSPHNKKLNCLPNRQSILQLHVQYNQKI